MSAECNQYWCVVGNISKHIISGAGQLDYKSGTKLFRGGTKVFIIGWFRGGSDKIVVIGQHRQSRKFIKCTIAPRYVVEWRTKVIYHPVVSQIRTAASDEGAFFISTEAEALEVKEFLVENFLKENARKLEGLKNA